MWRLIICILILLLPATPVAAADSEDVTIHARAYIAGAPVGFMLTYVTDTDILIEWSKGVDAVNTMIRAKYGEAPSGIDDGYLVYLGAGESVHDTALNLDETASSIYYKAWSQNAVGIWEEYDYGEGNIEGAWMTLIAFMVLALGLTIGSFAVKKPLLAVLASGTWALLGFYAYGQSTSTSPTQITDIYMGLFWLSMVMILGCIFEAVFMREKKEDTLDVGLDDSERMDDEYAKLAKMTRAPSLRRSYRKRKNKIGLLPK